MSDLNPSPDFEEKVRKAMQTPNANPEFANRLRNELVRRPVKMKPNFVLKPAWTIAFALVMIALIASTPVAVNALKKLFGYVPGVGLVESNGNLRMLAEPVSVTRAGVTVTVTSAFVYSDHVEVIYEMSGIAPENDSTQAVDAETSPKAFCGGMEVGDSPNTDGDPALLLPDGTRIERMFGTEYPQNVFATKPVYDAAIPANVMEMKLLIKCLQWSRLGMVPENWEIPLKLVPVPEGTVVGEPVVEVGATSLPATPVSDFSDPTSLTPELSVPAPVVTMTLERVVQMESNTILYFSMNVENKDLSLISIMPLNAYLIDSLGQKQQLMANYTWQPFEHKTGSAFEFMTQSKPADGPMTLVVENAVAIYAPLYTDPPQATPDDMSFTFNVGENPQYGQTWDLNREFEIAGYRLKVISARAANFADINSETYELGSQGYEYGYDFLIEADPSVKFQVAMDIMSEDPMCYLTNATSIAPDSSSLHYIQLCRDNYPRGDIRVTIGEISVLVENMWQVEWKP
jgi:hypothetical protein